MNLGTTVACLSSSRNIYSINNQTHQTSSATTTPPVVNKRPGIGRLSRKSSSNSSTKSQQNTKKSKKLESIKEGHQQQLQNVLYSANSYQDCPCEHHRLARLREESLHSQCALQENYVDLVTASFEASLAPLRGLLTPSISTGDSGVNTNSNGSRRSSGRAVRERTFSGGSRSSSSSSCRSELDAAIGCVTTTVIVEHNGCEDSRNEVWQRNNNRIITNTTSTSITQQRRDLIQISPENDPSQNWTLIKPALPLNNTNHEADCCDLQDEADSLFSSLKTSHSSSLKALTCTCPQPGALDEEVAPQTTHSTLRRVASYPRCHPNLDPHRFSLHFDGRLEQQPQNIHSPQSLCSLRQLPTVPPSGGVLPGQLFWPHYLHQVQPPQSSLRQPPNQHNLHLLRPLHSHSALTHYSSTQDFVKKQQQNQQQQPSNSSSQHPHIRRLQHRNASFPVFNGLMEAASVASKSSAVTLAETASSAVEAGYGGQQDIPPCVRNVIMHQIKSPRPKKTNTRKLIKKSLKTITLPEDPNDPTAFTLHLDQYDHYSLMRKQQKRNATGTSSNLVKIVGSFSIFMTIAIVITVLCFLYWSDTFKPMTMM